MRFLITVITVVVLVTLAAQSTKAASYSCMESDRLSATERAICNNHRLGALDERLDSWYRRAKIRAGYFDQTEWLRAQQREWLLDRDGCGSNVRCIRRHYKDRIEELRNYVEHV